MPPPDNNLFKLQQLLIDIALIDRSHYLAKTSRRENDIEHSMTVALLCWYIHTTHNLPLDLAKVFKYALSHDFVERYAGDVNTFASESARAQKALDEKESLEKLSTEFSDFNDLILTMNGYENKVDEESLFVWTVDKMQALIMGELDSWRPYAELDISFNDFCEKYSQLLAVSSVHSRDIFDGLIEHSKLTYYDRPN